MKNTMHKTIFLLTSTMFFFPSVYFTSVALQLLLMLREILEVQQLELGLEPQLAPTVVLPMLQRNASERAHNTCFYQHATIYSLFFFKKKTRSIVYVAKFQNWAQSRFFSFKTDKSMQKILSEKLVGNPNPLKFALPPFADQLRFLELWSVVHHSVVVSTLLKYFLDDFQPPLHESRKGGFAHLN